MSLRPQPDDDDWRGRIRASGCGSGAVSDDGDAASQICVPPLFRCSFSGACACACRAGRPANRGYDRAEIVAKFGEFASRPSARTLRHDLLVHRHFPSYEKPKLISGLELIEVRNKTIQNQPRRFFSTIRGLQDHIRDQLCQTVRAAFSRYISRPATRELPNYHINLVFQTRIIT